MKKLVVVLLSVLCLSSISFADVRISDDYYTLGKVLDDGGDQVTTCVRLQQGKKIGWWMGRMTQSYYQGIAGEIILDDFMSYEDEEGADKFIPSCYTSLNKLKKPSDVFKEGIYRVLKVVGNKVYIISTTSHSEDGAFWVEANID